MKSDPPQAAFRLLHDANNDPCRAFLHETLRFDFLDFPPAKIVLSTPSGEYTLRYRLGP